MATPDDTARLLVSIEATLPKGTKAGGGEVITINLRADSSVIADIADQRIETASGTIVRVAISESNRQVMPTVPRHQQQKAGGSWR
ncbi:hypothetical protein KXS15_09525 [Sinorhizobium meliloti]|uniref:hypothetical protein n=1 Tax=Rhizobium meliloti TaxID=382 RepID=UPI003F15BC2D